jgi:hypothetical protein
MSRIAKALAMNLDPWISSQKGHTQKSFTSEAQVNPLVLKFLLLAVHLLYFELPQSDLPTRTVAVIT